MVITYPRSRPDPSGEMFLQGDVKAVALVSGLDLHAAASHKMANGPVSLFFTAHGWNSIFAVLDGNVP